MDTGYGDFFQFHSSVKNNLKKKKIKKEIEGMEGMRKPSCPTT